jgi:hypothetical protein
MRQFSAHRKRPVLLQFCIADSPYGERSRLRFAGRACACKIAHGAPIPIVQENYLFSPGVLGAEPLGEGVAENGAIFAPVEARGSLSPIKNLMNLLLIILRTYFHP